MKYIYLFLMSIFLFYSCETKQELNENNTYKILSVLIDTYGKPNTPPPPPGVNFNFTKKQIDSINNQKQEIALFPILFKTTRSFSYIDKYDIEFNELTQRIKESNIELELNLSKINNQRPYELFIVDTIKQKKDKRYIEKNYDKLLKFSQIAFNNDFTKAALIVGVNMGPLNGYGALVLLKKIKGHWEIVGGKLLTIS